MDFKSKIILISGPTASGKSIFAIKLAKKINGEIINADSMQVYKDLRILTARPIKKEYKKIKHYLYGFQSVKNKFSAGKWLKLANEKIVLIKRRKKIRAANRKRDRRMLLLMMMMMMILLLLPHLPLLPLKNMKSVSRMVREYLRFSNKF